MFPVNLIVFLALRVFWVFSPTCSCLSIDIFKISLRNYICFVDIFHFCSNLFHAVLQGAEKPEKTDFINKLGAKIINTYWELFAYLHFLSVRDKHNLSWWVCLISRGKSLTLFSACRSQLAWPQCVCMSLCWATSPRINAEVWPEFSCCHE